jgi:hypothetical protein
LSHVLCHSCFRYLAVRVLKPYVMAWLAW